jgi:hypothetical protein
MRALLQTIVIESIAVNVDPIGVLVWEGGGQQSSNGICRSA